MLGRFIFTSFLAGGLWLSASPARAQIWGDHYSAGTEGIQAGSLPGPGIYFDDLNIGEYSSWTVNGAQNTVDSYRISTYINEPRFRWISNFKVLGANWGMELALPLIYQQEKVVIPPYNISPLAPRGVPFYVPGRSFAYGQFEVGDVEISPLLLSWHLPHFDFSAAYAVWVPTGKNTLTAIDFPINLDDIYGLPQFHWWEHLITLGGTWHPDAEKKWSLSALNHYEINQSFDVASESAEYGQLFTTEWGISRAAGNYFELGLVGNYSQQTTATGADHGPYTNLTFSEYSNVEVGPEVKITALKEDFSASIRYLREVSGSPGANLNVVALTLSKRF